jgi:transcriptional regulator with XRE-family HTH domain
MEQQGVSKVELARRLCKSRAYVTKALQGNTNFTMPSLIKIARALNRKVEVRLLSENDGSCSRSS